MEINWKIEEKDIDWSYTPSVDNFMKKEKKMFEDEKALALLLINEVIFLNDHWWEEEWPEKAQKISSINVNCNDIFAWGCADAEELPYKEIENLYRMWRKDPLWGPAVWCMLQRNEMPQKPVEKIIKEAGIWNLKELGLGENVTEDYVQYQMALLCKRLKDDGLPEQSSP